MKELKKRFLSALQNYKHLIEHPNDFWYSPELTFCNYIKARRSTCEHCPAEGLCSSGPKISLIKAIEAGKCDDVVHYARVMYNLVKKEYIRHFGREIIEGIFTSALLECDYIENEHTPDYYGDFFCDFCKKYERPCTLCPMFDICLSMSTSLLEAIDAGKRDDIIYYTCIMRDLIEEEYARHFGKG